MPCQITFISVVGILPSGGTSPISIRVTGTVTDCPSGRIGVKLVCSHGSVDTVTSFTPGAPGVPVNWTAEFTDIANASCGCNEKVEVTATCEGNENCSSTVVIAGLHCEPPPPTPCDTVVGLSANVEGCVGPNSTATVTLTATLTPPISGCSFTWTFGVGQPTITTTTPTAQNIYNTPGVFLCTVTVTCPIPGTEGFCSSSAAIMVFVPPCE